MADFAAESGHWYKITGEPCYAVPRSDGKGMRPTTLRDARKLNLLPSVTSIIRCAASPQLERWKRNQVLLAALTLQRREMETEEAYLKRIDEDWQAQGKDAADRGTEIHAAIEQHFRKESVRDDLGIYVEAATYQLPKQEWIPERSFASEVFHYGGKVDLHSSEWVIDIKTKDNALDAQVYDEHIMQLAAYRRGLRRLKAKCGILFVGRDRPEANLIEVREEELNRGWQMFSALLTYWRYKNGYFA